MVKLKIKSSSPSKSSPTQRKAGRKLKAEKEVPISTHRYNIVNSKDPIPLYAVKNKILDNELTEEEFKQTFVLFSMSYFIAPASGALVDLRILSAVQNVSRIHQLNMCKYVLEELEIGVRKAVRGAKYVRGCIMLLAIVYFHRYIKRGSKLINELPVIQHWNDQKFGDRLKREDAAGGLGHTDRSDVVFLISRKHSSESGEASSLPNNHVGNVHHIVVDLPVDIRTDEEVHSSSIDDVHELLLLNERDSELFCKRYTDTMNLIKLKMQASQVIQKVNEYINDVIIQPPSFDLFSQFYEDCVKLSNIEEDSVKKEKAPQSPLIQDYVKEHTIEESPISLEDILSNVFFDVALHEKEAANTTGCVYEKGVDVEDGKEDANADGKEDGKEEEKDDVKGDANVNGKEDEKDDVKEDEKYAEAVVAERADLLINAATKGDGVLEDNKDFRSLYLLHSESDEGLIFVVPKTFGCSIDCGEVDEQMVVLSKTMISAKHQPLARICSPTKDEKTPKSVLVDEVKSSFRSCIKNNKKECDLNYDMIFIPLHLGDHFSCLCINFIKRKVEYLDNVYKKLLFCGKDSELRLYCHTVFNIMSNSLVENGVPRGVEQGNKKEAMLNNLVEKRRVELEECRQSQKGKKRKSAAMKKTFCKKLKKSQSPSDSGAKSTVTSTFEVSASVSTPPAVPLSIMGDTPKNLKSVLGSHKRGTADDGLDCGGEDNQILLVSVFMRKNQKLLSKMLKLLCLV
ncbi:hypothetical protein KSS87_006415 [Heliosperma pusillum]|nr:hypothetical protein KSS87_006415 [Heliosperma pusillum]